MSATIGNRFRQLLQQKPVDQWQVQEIIILDWYDGITAGVCVMADPEVAFTFTQIAERDTDDVTSRLFAIQSISLSIIPEVRALVNSWTTDNAQNTNAELDMLLSTSEETHLLFESNANDTFCAFWQRTY